ncbi:MAG TPA: lysylphosphatidylglycerol synthase transmembrane domain-containing protein [Gaiellaceae bacterium]|nr:lysylphosphatidylglycerol synthase transmembrane domain-containing protein [Gaiellaceae bacterium]
MSHERTIMSISRPTFTLVLAGAAAAAALGATTIPLLGHHVASALHVLAGASRPWLVGSFVAFLGAFACTVGAWRSALAAAGARLCPKQAASRLAIGSMVNAFTPAKLGDAVKITLCARAIDAPDRMWTATGTYTALAAARSLTLAGLVVAASATHALPIWPVFLLVGCAAGVALAATASTRFRRHHRIASFLEGVGSLARDRGALRGVAIWTVGMQLSRLAGTFAVVLALGLPHPFLAALVILPALDLAGAVPVTPGSFGVGSGAVAVVLASRGIGMTDALATGLAIQGVETLVSVTCGSLGLAYLVQPSERVKRVATRAALVGAAATFAAVLGATILELV